MSTLAGKPGYGTKSDLWENSKKATKVDLPDLISALYREDGHRLYYLLQTAIVEHSLDSGKSINNY